MGMPLVEEPTQNMTRPESPGQPGPHQQNMKEASPATPTAHQHWLLLLAPQGFQALELRRGLLGWACGREHRVVIDPAHDLVAQLERAAAALVKVWKPRGRVEASVVLAPDVLGAVLANAPNAGNKAAARERDALASALPFAAGDLRLSEAMSLRTGKGADAQNVWQALWMHADWQLAIRQTFAAVGVDVQELFARAQMHLPALRLSGKANGRLSALVETDESFRGVYLHVYDAGGAIVRTTCVAASDPSAAGEQIRRELEALVARLSLGRQTHHLLVSPQARARVMLAPVAGFAEQTPHLHAVNKALLALWRSRAEGIVIQARWPRLQKRLQAASLVLGALGICAYGAMIWHGRQLDLDIDRLQAAERKNRPKVQAVHRQREQSLFMSAMVESHKQVSANPRAQAIDAVGEMAARIPPAATVLWTRSTPDSLAAAGVLSRRDTPFPDQFSLPGFARVQAPPAPDFVATQKLPFAVSFKRVEPPAPATSSALAGPTGAQTAATQAPAMSAAPQAPGAKP